MRKLECRREALFQYRGLPPVGMAVSMALQHLVAMIVGCVTPAIIIANVAGLAHDQRVLLIQASLVMSAVTTLLQLFPIGGRFGAGLPVIFGVSFAYLPSMQAIVSGQRRVGRCVGRYDRGRRGGSTGGYLHQAYPQAVPAGHYRYGSVHHRSVSVPHGHQLYGRRHRQHI